MKKTPFIGIFSFLIVLLTMPLGHAGMILMEHSFGIEHIFSAAFFLGVLGLILLLWGIFSGKEITATLLGLFAGLLVWTGWIEFAFVYYAKRYQVAPLMDGTEIATKPEYLIMPSTVGFWVIFMLYYLFGSKSGCQFFNWFQQKLKIKDNIVIQPGKRNVALTTFMELIMLLWTFYLVLLFSYDQRFAGDRHWLTYFVAFGSLFWSLILIFKLVKIKSLSYAIRYAIPTVIIFWNFVEIVGRWNLFHEIWIEPTHYSIEIGIMFAIFLIIGILMIFPKNKVSK